ncbi:MAG: hypothetical protein JW779_16410 [Candidatus Thorarchaeota archaeon]|nr:hypothetical protein [Candidatus Thorarchaeota archaeon]
MTDFGKARKLYGETLGFKSAWDMGNEVGWIAFTRPVKGAKIGLNLVHKDKLKRGSSKLTLEVTDIGMMK